MKPAQPFLDWLHQVDPTSTRLTLEDLQREPTIYLVPECDSQDQAIEYLGESVRDIFEEHLDGWYRVPAVCYVLEVGARESRTVRLRLADGTSQDDPFGGHYEEAFEARRREADIFYGSLTPESLSSDQALVMRQALAGMLWSKQHYFFDLDVWLKEHGASPFTGAKRQMRNKDWFHMLNDDIISMPDKWEYPWYAAWDLAFHTVPLAMVDLDFGKQQLELMLREPYLHPNGQIPAYEWNFGDVNPPVHAAATLMVYSMERELRGKPDVDFLKHASKS